MNNEKYIVEVWLFSAENPIIYETGWIDFDINALNGHTDKGKFICVGQQYLRKADIDKILVRKKTTYNKETENEQ